MQKALRQMSGLPSLGPQGLKAWASVCFPSCPSDPSGCRWLRTSVPGRSISKPRPASPLLGSGHPGVCSPLGIPLRGGSPAFSPGASLPCFSLPTDGLWQVGGPRARRGQNSRANRSCWTWPRDADLEAGVPNDVKQGLIVKRTF